MAPSDTDHAGPAEVAQRAARELAAIHAALVDLEEVLAGPGRLHGAGDPAAMRAMQSLDRVRQAAEGMATFLDRWAPHLPEGPRIGTGDLVAGLALRDLSDRLRGGGSPAAAGGEVDLF